MLDQNLRKEQLVTRQVMEKKGQTNADFQREKSRGKG